MAAPRVSNEVSENHEVLARYAQLWETLAIQIHGLNETSVVAMSGAFFHALDVGARRYLRDRMSRVTGSTHVFFVRDGMHPDRWLLGNYHELQAMEGSAIYQRDGIPTLTLNGPEPAFPYVGPGIDAAQSDMFLNSTMTSEVTTPESYDATSDSQTDGASQDSNTANTQATDVQVNNVHVPRPPNAYILYRKDNTEWIKKQYPGIRNNEISVFTGSMWNNESPAVRAQYAEQADILKAKHKANHPDYKYKPRRPGQVKRRAKRNNDKNARKIIGKVGQPRSIIIDGHLTDQHINVLTKEAEMATQGYTEQATAWHGGLDSTILPNGTIVQTIPTNPMDTTDNQMVNLEVPEINHMNMRRDINEWNQSVQTNMSALDSRLELNSNDFLNTDVFDTDSSSNATAQ